MLLCPPWRRRRAFPHVQYDSEKAQRRLSQMPVAFMRFKQGCFVVEKTLDGLYEDKRREISAKLHSWKLQEDKGVPMENTLEEFTALLDAAPNNGERERMKHLISSSHNMSTREATKFGMSNLRKRAEKVVSAAAKISAIKNKHLHFAKIEQKVFLQSIGRSTDGYLSSSSSESEYSEDEEDDDLMPDEGNNATPLDAPHSFSEHLSSEPEENHIEQPLKINEPEDQSSSTMAPSRSEGPSTGGERGGKDVPHIDVNYVIVLDILREVGWNWFSFVVLLEPKFERQGYTQEVFDQFLVDFASQLPNLGLSDNELTLVEQSRAAYLSEILQKEVRIQEIVEEVDSDDGNDYGDWDEAEESEILRKLKLIKDKGKRLAKSEIELNGLYGSRKSTERSSSVLARHPDIGEVMENIVEASNVINVPKCNKGPKCNNFWS